MSFDHKCFDLAKAFLDDVDPHSLVLESDAFALASDIQDTIETYLEDVYRRAKDTPGG